MWVMGQVTNLDWAIHVLRGFGMGVEIVMCGTS
jgi:hypothetical protein